MICSGGIVFQWEKRAGTKIRVADRAGKTQAIAKPERDRTTKELLPHAV